MSSREWLARYREEKSRPKGEPQPRRRRQRQKTPHQTRMEAVWQEREGRIRGILEEDPQISYSEIGKRLGTSAELAYYWLKKLGIEKENCPPGSPPISEEVLGRMAAQRRAGWTVREIARNSGYSYKHLSELLPKMGIKANVVARTTMSREEARRFTRMVEADPPYTWKQIAEAFDVHLTCAFRRAKKMGLRKIPARRSQ